MVRFLLPMTEQAPVHHWKKRSTESRLAAGRRAAPSRLRRSSSSTGQQHRAAMGIPARNVVSGLTVGNGLAAADDARSFIGSGGPQGHRSLERRIWTAVQTRPSGVSRFIRMMRRRGSIGLCPIGTDEAA
jgi:hypothetical protein